MKLKEKKIGSKEVFKGHILDLFVDDVICPNGHQTTREVIRHCKASCVLAQLDNGNFILEKQYRYPYDDVIFELPAGKADGDEDPKVTAKRELLEETGYSAKTIEFLGEFYPSAAYTDEIIYLYYATNLVKKTQHLDENESLEVLEYSFQDIEKLIKDGKIKDGKTLATFLYYKLKIGE